MQHELIFLALLIFRVHALTHHDTVPSDRHILKQTVTRNPVRCPAQVLSRKDVWQSFAGSIFSFGATALINPRTAAADIISPCPKPVSGTPANCISTASVRQLDLYMPPWVYPDEVSTAEVMARLKGAISVDTKNVIQGQSETYLRVQSTRNFAVDELVFVLQPEDHVIKFTSRQIEGPEINDFGAQRKRLEDIKKRLPIVRGMGEDFATADTAPREGALGQLKAFYGLKSGTGFEDIILEDDDL